MWNNKVFKLFSIGNVELRNPKVFIFSKIPMFLFLTSLKLLWIVLISFK